MGERGAILYDYWRSSASYRVRIALGLLELRYAARPVDLLAGAHKTPAYLALNPQGLVPTLRIDGQVLTQSLAMIEYLQATTPGATLLPSDPVAQARVRRIAYAVAIEIHPICNLSVAQHVADLTGGGAATRQDWMRRFIGRGLAAVEAMLDDTASGFVQGGAPGLAECCLIPQLYNAQRWGVDYAGQPRIARLAAACRDLPAFARAHPDRVRPTSG